MMSIPPPWRNLAISYDKVSGKSEISLFGQKKTNGVQSLDTPHLPKYMRKLSAKIRLIFELPNF